MKLYLLRPIDGDPLWEPWYDKVFGFVVRAETEMAARQFAHEQSGDENRGDFLNLKGMAWLNSAHSTCVELMPEGEAGVVITDLHSA